MRACVGVLDHRSDGVSNLSLPLSPSLPLPPPSLLRDMNLPSTPSTATTTLTQSMRCVSCSGRSSMHSSLRYASHLTSVLMTVDSTHAHASQIWKVEVHSITCTVGGIEKFPFRCRSVSVQRYLPFPFRCRTVSVSHLDRS